MKHIPAGVLGGAQINQIGKDGGVELEYGDVGAVTKYFVGSKAYYAKLADEVNNNDRIPKPLRYLIQKAIRKLAKTSIMMIKMAEGFDIPSFVSLEDVL